MRVGWLLLMGLLGCAEHQSATHVACPVLERETVAITGLPALPTMCGIDLPSAVDVRGWRGVGGIDFRTGSEVCAYRAERTFGESRPVRFEFILVDGEPAGGDVGVPSLGDACFVDLEAESIGMPESPPVL